MAPRRGEKMLGVQSRHQESVRGYLAEGEVLASGLILVEASNNRVGTVLGVNPDNMRQMVHRASAQNPNLTHAANVLASYALGWEAVGQGLVLRQTTGTTDHPAPPIGAAIDLIESLEGMSDRQLASVRAAADIALGQRQTGIDQIG